MYIEIEKKINKGTGKGCRRYKGIVMTKYENEFKAIGYSGDLLHDMQIGTTSLIKFKHDIRSYLIKKYGFAVLTEEVINKCKKYSPILEIGAGFGYWASEFQERGIECIPTDSYKYEEGYLKGSKYHVPVIKQEGLAAVRKYPHHTLLLCWPSCGVSWSEEVLTAYQGDYIIYCGESSGGCTGNDEFHSILDKEFNSIETISIPQFPGIHDYVEIFSRK